ncbi:MAG: response regulator [Deltaproteobacteria bacterium]|nr:response regulator [Deltaproteobacteria bacterium]
MTPAILIVEDDPSFTSIVQMRLKSWRPQAEIVTTKTIADARAVLAAHNTFSLAILDHHLPDGVGTELFEDEHLAQTAVLAVSSDEHPDIPAQSVKAGARHFLSKRQVTEKLFLPLLDALLARQQLEMELLAEKLKQSAIDTIKVLIATLEHEINNPLGAVLGGAYLVKTSGSLDSEQLKTLQLIEESGQRIKHVIKQLRSATDIESVAKGHVQTFHIPGDKPWKV